MQQLSMLRRRLAGFCACWFGALVSDNGPRSRRTLGLSESPSCVRPMPVHWLGGGLWCGSTLRAGTCARAWIICLRDSWASIEQALM